MHSTEVTEFCGTRTKYAPLVAQCHTPIRPVVDAAGGPNEGGEGKREKKTHVPYLRGFKTPQFQKQSHQIKLKFSKINVLKVVLKVEN